MSTPPGSPKSYTSPPHTRAQSINQHAPLTPSALRESHTLSSPEGSPEDVRSSPGSGNQSSVRRADTAEGGEPTNIADDDVSGEEGEAKREGSGSEQSPGSGRSKWVKISGQENEVILGVAGSRSPQAGDRTPEREREEGTPAESETSSLLGRPRRQLSLLRQPVEYFNSIFSTHEPAHPGPCNHGTFSPTVDSGTPLRPESISSIGAGQEYGTFGNNERSRPSGSRTDSFGILDGNTNGLDGNGGARAAGSIFSGTGSAGGSTRTWTGDGLLGRGKKKNTTNFLAERHGITNLKAMYTAYYVPFFAWLPQYRLSFLRGDLAAALTMSSFYLPMALSYASNLAHLPPINGLYAFAFQPLIYAFLGSCPQMVVGPEAAGSLLVGSVVRSSINKGHAGEDDDQLNAQIAGIVTGLAGAVIFAAGLTRLGFLDSVLSRPFLRGFISAIGFVIIVDQLIPEMGLAKVAEGVGGVAHGSSVVKLKFLLQHLGDVHKLTCLVAGVSFVIIMLFRELKKRLQPRFPNVAYFPDRFVVVVFSAILCHAYRWDLQGLEILGEVKSATGHPFAFNWPFRLDQMHHLQEAMATSFLIALLGFFESSVAAKSLGGGEVEGEGERIEGIALSPNRELVALGVANLVGGCFSALPAFGGYGRSKVNASTGGKTPMSSIFLSIITVICVLFLLPYFYYLPKAVLSSMITVVAYSLLEESPHDIAFFLRIRGVTELLLMLAIFLTTIFYSLSLGIATGIGLSLLAVIKHSTRPRIQILGRVPGTNKYVNAEENPEKLEFAEGCLIVKIPEPLTFANTGELKSRLRRLELYGTGNAHPALPRVRSDHHNRNVIFDIHGVTELDGSGTQVLAEIVNNYVVRGVRVYFSRGPSEGSDMWLLFERSGILEGCGGKGHFLDSVTDALACTERDDELDGRDRRDSRDGRDGDLDGVVA